MKNNIFTNRIIIAILSFLLIIFFFCPYFSFSASAFGYSQSFRWGLSNIATGRLYGEQFDPALWLFFALLLPIGILAVSLIKTINQKTASILIGAFSVIDLILLIGFSMYCRSMLADTGVLSYGLEYHTSFLYFLSILILIFLIAMAVFLYLYKLYFDGYFTALFTHENQQQAKAAMSNTLHTVSNTMSNLANSVQQSAQKLSTPTQPQAPATGVNFCPYCGAQVNPDYKFCPKCSKSLDRSKFIQQ